MLNAKQTSFKLAPLVRKVLRLTVISQIARENMDRIYGMILADGDFRDDDGNKVLNPRDYWRIRDGEDSQMYFSLCAKALEMMGCTLPNGNCPALVAEDLLRKAQHEMVDEAGRMLGQPQFNVNNILCQAHGLDKLKTAIDLCIKMVVNNPEIDTTSWSKFTRQDILETCGTTFENVRPMPLAILGQGDTRKEVQA